MRAEYGGGAEFLMVYIREAHASDEWVTPDNTGSGISISQPTTLTERQGAASQCGDAMDISFPVVVDDVDDAVATAYAAWPDRLYVVGADGRIAYQGGYGPFGFKPGEVRQWLEGHVGPRTASN